MSTRNPITAQFPPEQLRLYQTEPMWHAIVCDNSLRRLRCHDTRRRLCTTLRQMANGVASSSWLDRMSSRTWSLMQMWFDETRGMRRDFYLTLEARHNNFFWNACWVTVGEIRQFPRMSVGGVLMETDWLLKGHLGIGDACVIRRRRWLFILKRPRVIHKR